MSEPKTRIEIAVIDIETGERVGGGTVEDSRPATEITNLMVPKLEQNLAGWRDRMLLAQSRALRLLIEAQRAAAIPETFDQTRFEAGEALAALEEEAKP